MGCRVSEREQWIENIVGMLCNIGAIEHDSIPEVVHALRAAMAFADVHREPPKTFVRPEFPVEACDDYEASVDRPTAPTPPPREQGDE